MQTQTYRSYRSASLTNYSEHMKKYYSDHVYQLRGRREEGEEGEDSKLASCPINATVLINLNFDERTGGKVLKFI